MSLIINKAHEVPRFHHVSRNGRLEVVEGRRSASYEVFDPRNNTPRVGRILIARGRDASDVAISSTFGPNTLAGFRVRTDEVSVA